MGSKKPAERKHKTFKGNSVIPNCDGILAVHCTYVMSAYIAYSYMNYFIYSTHVEFCGQHYGSTTLNVP